MKILSRMAFSVYFTIMVYFTLNFFVGPCGLVEYHELTNIKNDLAIHLIEIKELNSQLRSDLILIQEDRSELEIRARKLGFYKPNEGLILVEGGAAQQPSNFPGYLQDCTHTPVNNSNLLALFSIISGLTCFSASLLIRRPSYGSTQTGERVRSIGTRAASPVSAHYSPV